MIADAHSELFKRLYRNRRAAHRVLFRHRHPQQTPDFHHQMIDDWHSKEIQYLNNLAFRGGAKSTIGEEAIAIMAGFREFKNMLIIGSNKDRAAERLTAIKHEIANNEQYHQVFGDLVGNIWSDTEIVLSTDIKISALGKGQALRGVKHLDQRPDYFYLDDLEEPNEVTTPEKRDKIEKWYFGELLPAMDPEHFGRVAATPLDPQALPVKFSQDPLWTTRVYPISYIDDDGMEQATWEERFPLPKVHQMRRHFVENGRKRQWDQEFMCVAEAPEEKPFKQEMMSVEPQVRTWQAVYAMFDPARTVKSTSSTTGFAVWSWIGSRLVIWDSWAKYLLPDKILEAIFDCHDTYNPTWIGVEQDGLHEFLMQPIRQEQIKRGQAIPVKPLKAPLSKLDFIRGLQPFFSAREVIFAKAMPDLHNQLLAFPSGKIDAPNALAYALRMRAGAPIYDGFSARHVGEELQPNTREPAYLCVNASRTMTTAVLVQYLRGAVRVYADWAREGDPGELLRDIVSEANLEAGRTVRVVGGHLHFDTYNNVGLRQAAQRIPIEMRKGGAVDAGRAHLRSLLGQDVSGAPAIMISSDATWTLNAFAGGYARQVLKQGMLADVPEEGPYRILTEGLESWAGLLAVGGVNADDTTGPATYAYTAGGRQYRSALPGAR